MSAVVAYVFSADPTESVGGDGPAYVRVHVRAAVRAGYEPHGFSAWGYTAHRAHERLRRRGVYSELGFDPIPSEVIAPT